MLPGVLSVVIFAATLVCVIRRPRGIGVGWWATAGALACLLTGVVHLQDIPPVIPIVGDATVAFVGIVLMSLVLDRAGLFGWAALHVSRWARGSTRCLFVLVIVLGAVVSAFFANDGAALILTPIVIGIVSELKLSAKAALAFVMACGFIADTGSVPLVISNLVNIVAADHFGISSGRYAATMVPVGLVAILSSVVVLLLVYGRSLPRSFDASMLRRPAEAIEDPLTVRAGLVVLPVLVAAYLGAGALHLPLAVVTTGGAVVLLVIAAIGRRVPLGATVRDAPWDVIVFSLGMYVVVLGLRNHGTTDLLAALLDVLGAHGLLVATLGVGVLVALIASFANNLPAILLAALAIDASGAGGAIHDAMVHASVIGADLGPKYTPIGSLATLLWLHVLARRGIHVSWGQYLRAGIVLTTPVLLVSLAALAGVLALQAG